MWFVPPTAVTTGYELSFSLFSNVFFAFSLFYFSPLAWINWSEVFLVNKDTGRKTVTGLAMNFQKNEVSLFGLS